MAENANRHGVTQMSVTAETSDRLHTLELAEHYEVASDPQYEMGKDVVLKKLAPRKGERILDIGCGTARVTVEAANKVGNGEVVGIDFKQYFVDIALKKARHNLSFEWADAHDLTQFHSNKFDAAYSNLVWHFLKDQAQAFCQVHDVLNSEGRFVFSTISAEHPNQLADFKKEVIEEVIEEVMLQNSDRHYPETKEGIAKFSTRGALETFLPDAGFRITDISTAPCVVVRKTAEDMWKFWNSSTFGCVIIELPEDLQPSGEGKMKERFQGILENGEIRMEMTAWIVEAYRD
ncbi:S-adenosyl-L-methionine-dependent methyltransferase [Hyaloscypha finlandica]|nr:S-adenosyl-L-methionine-dependent methyltransferase [Hyaloscypha finlandica]